MRSVCPERRSAVGHRKRVAAIRGEEKPLAHWRAVILAVSVRSQHDIPCQDDLRG
jgi:hypothetical protein